MDTQAVERLTLDFKGTRVLCVVSGSTSEFRVGAYLF